MARYWRTVITVVALTEGEEAPDLEDLSTLAYEIDEGSASGCVSSRSEEVSEERMARLLRKQGSDPSFLIMPPDGDDEAGTEAVQIV
jgi:hypothetical protein